MFHLVTPAQCSIVAPFLVDVAVNLTDCVYRGVDWHGKRIHEDDLNEVLQRAVKNNVRKVVITGTSLSQSVDAIRLCRYYQKLQSCEKQESKNELKNECEHVEKQEKLEVQQLHNGSEKLCLPEHMLCCTVGVHPAHCAEFTRPLHTEHRHEEEEEEEVELEEEKHVEPNYSIIKPIPCTMEDVISNTENIRARLEYLKQLIVNNRDVVIGVGEIGLDYTEVEYCPCDVQEFFFREQLRTFAPLHVPFIFHSRDCGMRFASILREWQEEQERLFRPLWTKQQMTTLKNDAQKEFWELKQNVDGDTAASAKHVPLEHERMTSTLSLSSLTTSKMIRDSESQEQIEQYKEEHMEERNTRSSCAIRGVVHSFNGSAEEQRMLLSQGLYLSINGSAFRTKSKAEQITCIPLSRLLMESDGPWCDIRAQDYGNAFVRTKFATRKRNKFILGACVERRNEPCLLVQVLEEYIGVVLASHVNGNAVDYSPAHHCESKDTLINKEISVTSINDSKSEKQQWERSSDCSVSNCNTYEWLLRHHATTLIDAKRVLTQVLYDNFQTLFTHSSEEEEAEVFM